MSRINTYIKRWGTSVRARAAKVRSAVKSHPRVSAGIAAGVVAIAAAGYLVAQKDLSWHPMATAAASLKEAASAVMPKKTLAELTHAAKEKPRDVDAQLAAGHAQFEAGLRASGIKSYQRALQLGAAPTEDMGPDLLTCFGKPEQAEANALIVQHKMLSAIPRLR